MSDDTISNAESVLNTYNLLKKTIDDPSSALPALLEACKSQGALSSLEIPDLRIHGMALNTMKEQCNNNGCILWTQMDAARKRALHQHKEFQQKQSRPGRGSKAELSNLVSEKQEEISQKNNSIIQYIDRYDHLLTLCRSHSKHDPALAAKINRHLERYSFLDQWNVKLKLRLINGGRDE
jgi:hypothetical protein